LSALNDPRLVREEYASEGRLLRRRAAYEHATGPDPRQVAFHAVAAVAPTRVLEVGCGPGELAARVRDELGADVVALDSSERMVELARGRGLTAVVGDVQELPFDDECFDCAIAAWMLYHVPDVPRAIEELARVLRPGGRLVAITNHLDHLLELRELVGAPTRTDWGFSGENGAELLRGSFARVAAVDASGEVRFPDRESVLDYVEAMRGGLVPADAVVPAFALPLVVRRRPIVFVADT
jgi:SAM-dependent methyltransferase